jgi:hypothetical protein
MNNAMIKSMVIDGVQYYSAYFSCPVCIERGTIYPPSFWVHYSCPNDHLYIGSDATLYCSGCGRKVKIMNTQYVCPHHSESGEHIVLFEGDSIDINGMSHITMPEAMSSAIALCDGRRGEWVTRFLHAL